jgi:hypothetical protein
MYLSCTDTIDIPGIHSLNSSKLMLGLEASIGPSPGANICSSDVSWDNAVVYGGLTSQASGYETVSPKNAFENCLKPGGGGVVGATVAAGGFVVVVVVVVAGGACGVVVINWASTGGIMVTIAATMKITLIAAAVIGLLILLFFLLVVVVVDVDIIAIAINSGTVAFISFVGNFITVINQSILMIELLLPIHTHITSPCSVSHVITNHLELGLLDIKYGNKDFTTNCR